MGTMTVTISNANITDIIPIKHSAMTEKKSFIFSTVTTPFHLFISCLRSPISLTDSPCYHKGSSMLRMVSFRFFHLVKGKCMPVDNWLRSLFKHSIQKMYPKELKINFILFLLLPGSHRRLRTLEHLVLSRQAANLTQVLTCDI